VASSCDANRVPTPAGELCRLRVSSIQIAFLLANFNVGGFGLANSSKRHNSNTKYEVFHTGASAQPILVLYGDTINEGRIIARRAWAASDGRGYAGRLRASVTRNFYNPPHFFKHGESKDRRDQQEAEG
jgi:hypothetical protein